MKMGKEYKKLSKIESKNRGFEICASNAKKIIPEKKIKDLESIWNGDDINS